MYKVLKHTCFAFGLFAMNATPARRVTPSWHIYMANCCNKMHLCKWVSMCVGSVLECVPCARASNQIIVYTSPNYRNKINSATHSESLQLSPRLTGLPYLADRATRLGGSPHLSWKRDRWGLDHGPKKKSFEKMKKIVYKIIIIILIRVKKTKTG